MKIKKMYIEQITIHFSTKRKPIQVVGGSAQELFDQKAYHNDVVLAGVRNVS